MRHSAHSSSLCITPYLKTLTRLTLEPILIHYQIHSYFAQKQKVVAANQKRVRKTLNFVSQSESSITSPKATRELSARVEDPSRLSAPLGLLQLTLIHWVFHPVSSAHYPTTVLRVVVFFYWKCFMDHVHIIISLNIGLFHLLLLDN